MDYDLAEELRIAKKELKYWKRIRAEKRGFNKHEHIPFYEIDRTAEAAGNRRG